MGFSWSVFLTQLAHRHLLSQAGLGDAKTSEVVKFLISIRGAPLRIRCNPVQSRAFVLLRPPGADPCGLGCRWALDKGYWVSVCVDPSKDAAKVNRARVTPRRELLFPDDCQTMGGLGRSGPGHTPGVNFCSPVDCQTTGELVARPGAGVSFGGQQDYRLPDYCFPDYCFLGYCLPDYCPQTVASQTTASPVAASRLSPPGLLPPDYCLPDS